MSGKTFSPDPHTYPESDDWELDLLAHWQIDLQGWAWMCKDLLKTCAIKLIRHDQLEFAKIQLKHWLFDLQQWTWICKDLLTPRQSGMPAKGRCQAIATTQRHVTGHIWHGYPLWYCCLHFDGVLIINTFAMAALITMFTVFGHCFLWHCHHFCYYLHHCFIIIIIESRNNLFSHLFFCFLFFALLSTIA